ncbi:hypothetical protein C5167_030387 [Papaver somniferum]|nr:hypothetical protein C5167_030387 [Papaver somniferum]
MALHVAGKFQRFLLLLWVQLVSAEMPAPAFRPITKPHCVDKCGKVSIPYPFGIYNGCYADKWFKITCNDSLDSPKPVYRGFDVSHISLLDSQMRIEVNTTTYCSDEKVLDDAWTADLGKLTFSSTKNKLIVSAALCWSICNTTKDITDGSCLGIGCCDVNVPAGLSKYNATPTFDIIDNTTNLSSKFCGHAFLVEESSFKFSSKYLKDFNSHGTKTVPAVVDWAIGNETCDAVRKSRSYACGPNTVCISGNADVPGYRCKYIDECGNSNRSGGGVKCMNTPGSYRCFCSPGKHLESTPQRPYICKPNKRRFPIATLMNVSYQARAEMDIAPMNRGAILVLVQLVQIQDEAVIKNLFVRVKDEHFRYMWYWSKHSHIIYGCDGVLVIH